MLSLSRGQVILLFAGCCSSNNFNISGEFYGRFSERFKPQTKKLED